MAIDIVGFLVTQEPIASWTSAKKQEMLELFCKARGYSNTIDRNGELIPNPQSKSEFVNADLMQYLFSMINNEKLKQAKELIKIDKFNVDN